MRHGSQPLGPGAWEPDLCGARSPQKHVASSRTGSLGSRVGTPRLPELASAAPGLRMVPRLCGGRYLTRAGFLETNCRVSSDPKRFTQSMKLDGELGRLMLEHGTMLGPPTEAERAEERARKELARKVRSVRSAGPRSGFLLVKVGSSQSGPDLQTCPNVRSAVREGVATVPQSRAWGVRGRPAPRGPAGGTVGAQPSLEGPGVSAAPEGMLGMRPAGPGAAPEGSSHVLPAYALVPRGSQETMLRPLENRSRATNPRGARTRCFPCGGSRAGRPLPEGVSLCVPRPQEVLCRR